MEMLRSSKGEDGSDYKVEDEFQLPYGLGFDDLIKQKADLVNNKKFENNKLMDNLVEKLGYMDYRDMLAAHKYLLDAKRHGDYHQQARAKTLAIAFSRMTKLKRDQLDQEIAAKLRSDGKAADVSLLEDEKLKTLMESDEALARVYQEVYKDVRDAAEYEADALRELHSKFDKIYDKEQMRDKLDSRWYNLDKLNEDEDLQFSTEFSSAGEDLAYKRYKMKHHQVAETVHEYAQRIDELQRRAEAGTTLGDEEDEPEHDDEGRAVGRNPHSLLAKAVEEHREAAYLSSYVETRMA